MRSAVIFDLDNTLVQCSRYYEAAVSKFVSDTSTRTGLPEDIVRRIVGTIDVEMTRLPDGFSASRFPLSFAATSAALDVARGKKVDDKAVKKSYQTAEAVFSAPYPLYPGVVKVLNTLRTGGWHLILCSKGVPEIQMRKVKINRLDRWFSPERIYITLVKSVDHLKRLLVDQRVDIASSWYVGDSVRDDIGPANAVGLKSVLVGTGSRWGYETEEHEPTAFVNTVSDLLTVIPPAALRGKDCEPMHV